MDMSHIPPIPALACTRSFATTDLTEADVEAIAKARMASRHDHLDKLLDE